MSSQELIQNIVPLSPTVDINPQNSPDTPYTNLFEDVALVKNHLDCLGIKHNPNNIADLLLQYDSNDNRVNLVVNRIIDEPPDVEITFEKSSPNKTFLVNSGSNSTLDKDGIIEIKSVKKLDDDVIVEKVTKNETTRVINSNDDFSPSPTKYFKSVNPGKNPFLADLPSELKSDKNKLPDFSCLPSTSKGKVSDAQKPEDTIIAMSEIEDFLNSKDTNFLDADANPVPYQSFAEFNERLKKLENSDPKASNRVKKNVQFFEKCNRQTDNQKVDLYNLNQFNEADFLKKQCRRAFKFPTPTATITKESDVDSNSTETPISHQAKLDTEISTRHPSSSSASIANGENVKNSSSTSSLLDFSNDFDLLSSIMDDVSTDNLKSETSIQLLNNAVEILEGTQKKVGALIKESVDTKSASSFSKTAATTEHTKILDMTIQIESDDSALSDVNDILDLAFVSDSVGINETNEVSLAVENSTNVEVSLHAASTSKVEILPMETLTASIKNQKVSSTVVSSGQVEVKPVASSSKTEIAPASNRENSKIRARVSFSNEVKVIPDKTPNSSAETSASKSNKPQLNETIIVSSVKATPLTSTSKDKPMPKYLPNLMEIFPDADTDYLRDLYKNIEGKVPDQQILPNLIDKVMENPNYPRRNLPNIDTSPVVLPVNEMYQNITAIFPNIDPEFLENKCKELTNDEKYGAFINELLTTKEYPTLKDYERRKETEKAIKAYTDNFTISGFLEVFPDPEDYFLNKKSSTHQEHSMAFLKDRYKLLRVDDIDRAFKLEKQNLTKTCLRLDAHKGTVRKTRRNAHECRWPAKNDVNFLQEISFIKNRTEIMQFIEKKKKQRENAFKLAKENNELFTCGCCYDDEVMNDDVITCQEGHIFCINCVKRLGEIKLGERSSKIECMASECVVDFTLKDLQKALPPNAFSRFVKLKQSDEIKAAGIEGLESCPFCDFASIPPPEDKIFKCLNPDCMKEVCRECNEESHIPLRCEEVERNTELKARLLIEEKMTEALMRECYECKTKFIKEDGCNKMTCSKCGAFSCYICRQPVKNYDHFNGDNGSNVERCPLYSENDVLHVEAVQFTAQEVKNKLLKENPNLNLKIDPTLVLPEKTYKKKHAVPAYRQQQRGLVLNRALPVDVPRDNLPPIDLRPPEPVIPPHLLQQDPQHRHQPHVHNAFENVVQMANQLRLQLNGANLQIQGQNLHYHAPVAYPPPAAHRAQPYHRPQVQRNGVHPHPVPPQDDLEDSDDSNDSGHSYESSFIDDDGLNGGVSDFSMDDVLDLVDHDLMEYDDFDDYYHDL